MVAARLRSILALALIAAFLAARALGAGYAGAAASAILAVFALHVLLILTSFAIALSGAREAVPGGKSGFAAMCGTIAAECFAYFVLFAIVQPFETLFAAAKQKPAPAQKLPVMLVHGYVCNRGLWWWIGRQLRANWIAAVAVNLEPPYASIDALADALHGHIEAYARETGSEKLVLVTHSMGGLAARAYLKRHAPQRVAKLITLACPHHGTRLGYLGFGLNARQMQPGSAWLCELSKAEPLPIPALTVWSAHDNFVAPQTSSRLEGAREITLGGLGHLSFVFSPRIVEILLQELS